MKDTQIDNTIEIIDIGTCSLFTIHSVYKTSHN